MRVMVTGGAGFIGSRLCWTLAAQGHDVLAVDSFDNVLYPSLVKRQNANFLLTIPGIEIVEHDLQFALPPHTWDGVDVVVNQAAIPGLVPSWQQFSAYLASNTLATKQLLDAAMEADVKHFVHVSTSSIYGKRATTDESGSQAPSSPYGVSKLAAEALLNAYFENFNLPMTILRYFSVYGPGQRPDMAYHIFCERLLAGEKLVIFGDGRQARSNTHITDSIRGTIAAIERPPSGTTYNIAGGEEISLLEVVEVLSEALETEARIEFHPRQPGDQDYTRGICLKAEQDLGYRPLIPIREGLADQANWHRLGRPPGFLSKWANFTDVP